MALNEWQAHLPLSPSQCRCIDSHHDRRALTSGRVDAAGGVQLEYAAEIHAGAILLTQSWVEGFDVRQPGILKRWAMDHLPAVFKLAKDLYDLHAFEDLILVTGYDAAEQYAMAVASDRSAKGELRFKVGMPNLADVSAAAWGSWSVLPSVVTNLGPQVDHSSVANSVPSVMVSADPSARPEVQHDPGTDLSSSRFDPDLEVQGITRTGPRLYALFIRGYRLRKRHLLGAKIRAASGYDDLGDPDPDEKRGASELVAERIPDGVTVSAAALIALQCVISLS